MGHVALLDLLELTVFLDKEVDQVNLERTVQKEMVGQRENVVKRVLQELLVLLVKKVKEELMVNQEQMDCLELRVKGVRLVSVVLLVVMVFPVKRALLENVVPQEVQAQVDLLVMPDVMAALAFLE